MNDKLKIYYLVIILLTITLPGNLYAYSASKHHRYMGVRAADESNLDTYLKNNLGFSKGINTILTNLDEPVGEQTKNIYEWIGYGAVKEDSLVPYPRVLNHFYDPVSDQGLMTLANSLEWAKDQSIIDNDYSWAKAREYYYLALTSPTKEERGKYWALTCRSLGQVLHLVQDLASPAHVRNDSHLSSSNKENDPYESIWGTSSEGESFIKLIMLLGELGNTDYQYPVVELDQFDDYWDTEDGRGLAEFTNSNFVSKDTNLDRPEGDPHHYDNPQATGEYREPFTFTDSAGRMRTVGVNYVTSNVVDNYAPGRSVNPFNYLTTHSFFNFYTEQYDLTQRSYTLNRKCHEEYAKLLIPRTVGYGAGLLNYFFRKELNVRTEIDLEGWLVFYVSTEEVDIEDLYNHIEIYGESMDGFRYKIDDPAPESDHFQKDIVDNEVRLMVDIYTFLSVRFIIVYNGPESEDEEAEGIVIGKVLNIVLNIPTLENYHYYLEKSGGTEERNSTYSNTRNIAYQNFINNFPELHVYWWTPETFIVRIDGAGISYDDQHHAADQLVWRGYVGYDFSFFQDKTVDRVLLVLIWSAPDANLVVYRDSANTWPPIWGGGDVFLFSPAGPFYEGRYRFTGLIELPLNLLNLSGPNVFEARYIGDTLNWIPTAPGEDGRGWSGTLIEIIYYSEEDNND